MGSSKPRTNQSSSFEAIIPGVSQKKAFTAVSSQSTALSASTSVVRLFATEDCHIKTGANPTAVADGTCMFLPADREALIGVGSGDKIAVIRDTVDGVLFITEGA